MSLDKNEILATLSQQLSWSLLIKPTAVNNTVIKI